MTMSTNLMQFPTPATKPSERKIVGASKAAATAAAEAAAAEKLDLIKIDQLTASIYAISFNAFFKNNGFTMDHLAAAALSVATQHMAGTSEEGLAITAEAYAKE
jgi:hypothetical protein